MDTLLVIAEVFAFVFFSYFALRFIGSALIASAKLPEAQPRKDVRYVQMIFRPVMGRKQPFYWEGKAWSTTFAYVKDLGGGQYVARSLSGTEYVITSDGVEQ